MSCKIFKSREGSNIKLVESLLAFDSSCAML